MTTYFDMGKNISRITMEPVEAPPPPASADLMAFFDMVERALCAYGWCMVQDGKIITPPETERKEQQP